MITSDEKAGTSDDSQFDLIRSVTEPGFTLVRQAGESAEEFEARVGQARDAAGDDDKER